MCWIHLTDCKNNHDAHLPFGLGGSLPIDARLETLTERDFNVIINLELLPRTKTDIKTLINSYLKVIKSFNRIKYCKTKFKIYLFTPLISKTLKNTF